MTCPRCSGEAKEVYRYVKVDKYESGNIKSETPMIGYSCPICKHDFEKEE